MLKTGVQLFTVRDFCKSESEIRKTFKKIATLGFEYVQVSGIFELPPKTLKDILDENNLKCVVTHNPSDKLLDDIDFVIEKHKILDCADIGLGMMPEKYMYIKSGVRNFLDDFHKSIEKINGANMRFHYHNHAFEFMKFDGKTQFDELVELSTPLNVGFIVDTFWVQRGGCSVGGLLKRLKGRTDFVHFKDYAFVHDNERMAAVGNGNIDFVEIIKICNNIGVRFALIEQDDCYGLNPFDELKKSFDYLQPLLQETNM